MRDSASTRGFTVCSTLIFHALKQHVQCKIPVLVCLSVFIPTIFILCRTSVPWRASRACGNWHSLVAELSQSSVAHVSCACYCDDSCTELFVTTRRMKLYFRSALTSGLLNSVMVLHQSVSK